MIDWQFLFYRSFYYFCNTIIVYVAIINSIYFFLMILGFFALRLTPALTKQRVN